MRNIRPALRSYISFPASLLVLALVTSYPQRVFAECQEYKVVEYEDRVEAVCVGEPLTEAQKNVIREEEKKLELENNRQRALEEKRQKEAEAADAKSRAQAEADRKKQATKPVQQQPAIDRSKINPMRF